MTTIPKTFSVLLALAHADLTTLWKNRRAVIFTLLVPAIILIAYKDKPTEIRGAASILASGIRFGLMAIGLLGYPSSIALDRNKGIFQRLRIAPIPKWTIMGSRLITQLLMILLMTTIVFIVGYVADGITISPAGYALTYITAILCGAMCLSIGQLVVGLISNPEVVNGASRLLYVLFIILGVFSQYSGVEEKFKNIYSKSPFGAMQTVLGASLSLHSGDNSFTLALLLTICYMAVFATIGIKNFKWVTK